MSCPKCQKENPNSTQPGGACGQFLSIVNICQQCGHVNPHGFESHACSKYLTSVHVLKLRALAFSRIPLPFASKYQVSNLIMQSNIS